MKLKTTNYSKHPRYISDHAEYEALGAELKETNQDKLAENFGISRCGLSSIKNLTVDEFKLIQTIISDRSKTLERRAFLRRMLAP